MLFEVAVIEEPTKKAADEEGAVEKLILAPQSVIARDQQLAVVAVLREHQEIDLTKVKVLVRAFA